MRSPVQRLRDFISGRSQDYTLVFSTIQGQRVLADLAKFCRAHETTFHLDARAHAVAEGRREVWLRIQRHLNLTDEQLWKLHGAAQETKE